MNTNWGNHMRMVVVFLVSILLFAACDSSGGGGGTTPGETDARIVESFTCRDVDAQGRPSGISEVFYSDVDQRIYLWVSWKNVRDTHIAETVWYNPGGHKDYESSEEFTSTTGEQVVWFYLAPGSMTMGRWEVEIWLDNEFHRSHFFVIEN